MTKKIGILGGGQLGRLFLQVAYNYPFQYHILDSQGAPCQAMCDNFHVGNFADYDDVIRFGEQVDVVGIEIEHVNTEALKALEAQGKTVIPSADTLSIIKDKGLQKQHYAKHHITAPDYYLLSDKDALNTDKIKFPFVQKLRTGGYDGKGVQILKSADELDKLWDAPSVIEAFTPIIQEIAVMVVKGQAGECVVYPPVEMVFDPELNLVDYLVSPANITESQQETAIQLARQVADSFDSAGIFAVELFVDDNAKLWVNEVAPRVHNSGHHTIEASYCSQFEQMLRVLAGLPLGNPNLRERAAMINLIGAPNHSGKAMIEGMNTLSKLDKTYVHWYGKALTNAGRKMGHITVLGEAIETTLAEIKRSVRVISEP